MTQLQELSEKKFKLTLTNMVKKKLEKVNCHYIHIWGVSAEIENPLERNKWIS